MSARWGSGCTGGADGTLTGSRVLGTGGKTINARRVPATVPAGALVALRRWSTAFPRLLLCAGCATTVPPEAACQCGGHSEGRPFPLVKGLRQKQAITFE